MKHLDAVERVRRYLRIRNEKPLMGLTGSIHQIHMGTEWEAELTIGDVQTVLNQLDAMLAGHK